MKQGSRQPKRSTTKTKPTLVDNSTLAALSQCTTRTAVQNVMGYTSKEESAPLLCGKAVHAGIETFLRGSTADEALRRFASLYQEWSNANLASGTAREYSNVAKILGRWLEENPLDRLPYTVHPDKIEVFFAVPLDDNGEFVLCGLMDAVVQDHGPGLLWPLDHKTTAMFNQDFVRKFRNDSQISGYSYALSYLTGQPVVGALINVLEIKKLPSDAKRKCKEHGVPYVECGLMHAKYQFFSPDRTQDQIDSWRQTAIKLARDYKTLLQSLMIAEGDRDRFEKVRTLPTEGEFNGSCAFCGLFDWCSTGRLPAMAEATLKYEPWITEDGLVEAKRQKERIDGQGNFEEYQPINNPRRGTLRRPRSAS